MKKISVLTFCLFALIACKKEKLENIGESAAINVYNTIPFFEPSTAFKINFTGHKIDYSKSITLDYFYNDGSNISGKRSFGVEVNQPVPLKIVSVADTTTAIFEKTIVPKSGEVYSLFFSGNPSVIDTLLIKENIPDRGDNKMKLRFINLSPDARKININVAGEASGSLVKELAYKKTTSYIIIQATQPNLIYKLEIRDAETEDLLTVYEFNPQIENPVPAGRSLTLVLRGLKNGWPGLEFLRINNY